MIENFKARVLVAVGAFVMAVAYLVPNFTDVSDSWWITKNKLVYGLDIQGGVHLVLGVDVHGVIEEKLERLARGLRTEFEEKNFSYKEVRLDGPKKNRLVIELNSAAESKAIEDHLARNYGSQLQVLDSSGSRLELQYFASALSEVKEQTIAQSIEVIRNRIDEFGVAEPIIAASGDDRIVVQLPGIEDSARAKELINKTARLEFLLVDEKFAVDQLLKLIDEAEEAGGYKLDPKEMPYSVYLKRLNEDLAGKIPENRRVAFEKLPNAKNLETGRLPQLLETELSISGADLDDAFVGAGERGEPVVQFRLNPDGARRMGELTSKNIKRRMAIVLDGVIQSAPSINSKITSSGQITMGGRNYEETMAEAKMIATALRAGALPAALTQLEERTVGPTLGADSIRKGKFAGLIGLILVIGFMLLYYRTLGLVANISLMMNVALLLAILTSLGATLTLPGVAGIVLTLGMAVDANVIIFERIKEELSKGGGLISSIKNGFDQAFSAIFDANMTTGITSVILMYFGTGPVRGFAVTLLIGLITSMFTALFISRLTIDILVLKMGIKKLTPVRMRAQS